MSVQPVNKRLYAWFVDMSDIGRCLTRLSANDDCLRVDKTESIYDDFALHRLDRVNDDGYRTRVKGFEGLDGRIRIKGLKVNRVNYLLCVYIDARQPASKSGM